MPDFNHHTIDDASVPPEWILTDWYPSLDSEKFKKEVARLQRLIDSCAQKFNNTEWFDDPDLLFEAVQSYLDIEALKHKLENFVSMMRDKGTYTDDNQLTEITKQLIENHRKLTFFINGVTENKESIKEIIDTNTDLESYKSWFEKIWRLPPSKPGFQKEVKETALNHYSQITNISVFFDGKPVPIGTVNNLRRTSDCPEERARAAEAYYKGIKTIAFSVCDLFNKIAALFKERADDLGCKPWEIQLWQDNIDPAVIQNLVNSVSQNYDVMHSYLALNVVFA